MKEASGELSMTAVAVVAIAAIGVLFSTLIWPNIRRNITRNTNCSQAFNCTPRDDGQNADCFYCEDDDCTTPTPIVCTASQIENNNEGS